MYPCPGQFDPVPFAVQLNAACYDCERFKTPSSEPPVKGEVVDGECELKEKNDVQL